MEFEGAALMYEMGKWDAIAGQRPAHPDNDDYMMGYTENSE
jgi:hypothetical protein